MPPNEISTEYHFEVYGQGAKVIKLTPPNPLAGKRIDAPSTLLIIFAWSRADSSEYGLGNDDQMVTCRTMYIVKTI